MKEKKILPWILMLVLTGTFTGIPKTCFVSRASPGTIYVPDDYSTIQAAIDSANEGDTIIVRSDTYREDIDIDKQLTIQGENKETTIIDGLGAGQVVDIEARDVILSGFTVLNGSMGIYLDCADRSTVSDCVIYDCSWSGIRGYSANYISIKNSAIYDTDSGIDLDCSCFARIMNTICCNNSWVGIEITDADNIQMINCDCYNNTWYGIHCTHANVVTICNSTSHDNEDDGINIYGSEKFYMSKSETYDNLDDGIYFYESEGIIVNCNISNNDDGLAFWESNARIRYCRIEDNHDMGIFNWLGTINATRCWWGAASGPYHPTLNPTGTGDEVDNDVDFDPWQTSFYQIDALLSDLRCRILRADESTVYYVPTGNIYDDSTFYAFYAYKEYPQIIIPPTQSSASDTYLDGDGSPLFDGDIVTFGGKFANRLVAYYEDAGIAKIGFANNGTHRIFRRISDGAHVYAVDSSTYNESERDYFAFQVYRDGPRYILSEWGIRAPGTYAGGICFIDVILPNVGSFTNSYCTFSWTDTNGDGKPQSDEIVLEASGN